jgi:lipopolysaccharide transport system permease protein
MTRNAAHSLRVPHDWIGFVWYLATESIKRQYARTRLGPLWIILTQFVMIAGIAFVFFSIFKRPLDQFLLLISASILAWNFMSLSITTAPMVFTGQSSLIQSFPLPFSIFPLQTVLNALIIFLHGLAVHVVLMLMLGGSLKTLPFLLISIPVLAAILYPVTAALGILGARYRDLSPLVGSIMYMAFLITPIIWDRLDIGGRMTWIVDLNPFYHMIEIIRRPMLGTLPSMRSMIAALSLAAISLVAGEMFFRRYARPLPFWV